MTLPRLECVAAAAVMRSGRRRSRTRPPRRLRARSCARSTGFVFRPRPVEPASTAKPAPPSGLATVSSRRGGGASAPGRAANRAAIGAGLPAGVWALNRLLRADFDADLSAAAITRSGIAAATETDATAAGRRRPRDHRPHPPRPARKRAKRSGRCPAGARSTTPAAGSSPPPSTTPARPPGPYWPGTVTWLKDDGPPRRVRLLIGPAPRRAARRRSGAAKAAAARATRR